MLSFPMYMARFELLCIQTDSFTHMICFQGGEDKDIGRGRFYRRKRRAQENRGHMKLNPAGQDAAGSVSVEADMPGSIQN